MTDDIDRFYGPSAPSPPRKAAEGGPDALAGALRCCRHHLVAAAGFSALVNLLYIVPTLYMLQVYDRVVPTGGLQTLAFLTGVLLFALACLALLDRIRGRLLVRAGVRLDLSVAPLLLDATIGRPGRICLAPGTARVRHAARVLSGPATLALFDAPWTPIYILVCFLVHPWIGVLALVGGGILAAIAWLNERATRPGIDRAQEIAQRTYAAQDAALTRADSVRALGMRRALVSRQLRQRTGMVRRQTETSFHASGYVTATKFVRLALQSLALGLGALLAVDNLISGGAIFASSFLIARALAPIEVLIGSWRTLAQARAGYRTIEALLATAPSHRVATRLPTPRGALAVEGGSGVRPQLQP